MALSKDVAEFKVPLPVNKYKLLPYCENCCMWKVESVNKAAWMTPAGVPICCWCVCYDTKHKKYRKAIDIVGMFIPRRVWQIWEMLKEEKGTEFEIQQPEVSIKHKKMRYKWRVWEAKETSEGFYGRWVHHTNERDLPNSCLEKYEEETVWSNFVPLNPNKRKADNNNE